MRKLKVLKIVFYTLIFISLVITIYEIWKSRETPAGFVTNGREINEDFRPDLSRLRSVSEFTVYCDSIYESAAINKPDLEQYALIVNQALRDKFYHGYSYYSVGQNTFACILAPVIKKDLTAIVIPNDILRQPMAACSQQSIIGMEVFKRKGLSVRKIGFFSAEYGGHFCFEVFFNNRWHFFDPDLEPELSIMAANHFPSISELVKNDSLLKKFYVSRDKDLIEKLFPTYFYGPVNKFPAPNARFFQYVTKYLSYTAWLFLILLYFYLTKGLTRLKKKEKCAELQDSLVSEKA
jgi:hypothetical protein